MALSGIELLNDAHRLGSFDCSKAALDAWLAGFARTNQARGFTRVQIIHDQDAVVGYYGLAPGVIQPNSAPRAIRTGRRPPQGFIPARQSVIDRPHHHRAAHHDVGAGDAAMQRVLDRAAADALPGIAVVEGELSDQQGRIVPEALRAWS
ncbi:N-acetyltransferase [Mesorhizobium sp. M0598]|uniref:N-acetyltransferase n=1 Tax=Mesorhizobium sp. M0598 TaxID=2956968 RepID=UPI00333AE9C9